MSETTAEQSFDIVIVGGGAGGIATAASILARSRRYRIAIVEPKDVHYYQPGFTMVGGGIFKPQQTVVPMGKVMPAGTSWIQHSVDSFEPEKDRVKLSDGSYLNYQSLVVSPGLQLNWAGVEGLPETLGKNGVTSNYDPEHCSYTWNLVQGLREGKAVFTQPPMPIKCAGAPQKAMYLSSDHWKKQGVLGNIDVSFYAHAPVLFGVADYVPALENDIADYGISTHFGHNLIAVDGDAKTAVINDGEQDQTVEFDMLHVCPPQKAPDFISDSDLSNEAGWVEVDQATMQHTKYQNVFSLGDVCSTPNAKTAAAVRKQAPVVAYNLLAQMNEGNSQARYDGYGSCPLTVERGRVVLAEFGYGGKLLPTAPSWLLEGKKPTYLGWVLKANMLPTIYFELMLKGREWLAKPAISKRAEAENG